MAHEKQTILEKALVVLPHWVEHNTRHIEEYEKWAALLLDEGVAGGAADIAQAVEYVTMANNCLLKAQKKAEEFNER